MSLVYGIPVLLNVINLMTPSPPSPPSRLATLSCISIAPSKHTACRGGGNQGGQG